VYLDIVDPTEFCALEPELEPDDPLSATPFFVRMTLQHIHIAADHAGFARKTELIEWLTASYPGIGITDHGTHSEASMDYPDVVHPLAQAIQAQPNADAVLGVLICGSGNGVCITANKYPAVRAAMAWAPELASLARQHNNANVLCMPARFTNPEAGVAILKAFLEAKFEGGRHANRVEKISSGICGV
jgi:ribose 5-phosphate isomerase B